MITPPLNFSTTISRSAGRRASTLSKRSSHSLFEKVSHGDAQGDSSDDSCARAHGELPPAFDRQRRPGGGGCRGQQVKRPSPALPRGGSQNFYGRQEFVARWKTHNRPDARARPAGTRGYSASRVQNE